MGAEATERNPFLSGIPMASGVRAASGLRIVFGLSGFPSIPKRQVFMVMRISRLPLLALALVLAGCSTADRLNPFSSSASSLPPCPRLAVLDDVDRLTVFRDGPGRDVTDILFEARILGVRGECRHGDGRVAVETDISFEALRGPADLGRQAQIRYFVAVVDPQRQILNKRIFEVVVAFPPNADRGVVTDQLQQMIPLTAGRSAAAYTVAFGLQLDADQLDYNRGEAERLSPPRPPVSPLPAGTLP